MNGNEDFLMILHFVDMYRTSHLVGLKPMGDLVFLGGLKVFSANDCLVQQSIVCEKVGCLG